MQRSEISSASQVGRNEIGKGTWRGRRLSERAHLTSPVVVVHWNRPRTCAQSVESFLSQSVRCRVVVYDNASTPELKEALKDALARLPGVEVVWGTTNRGFAGATAEGLARAFGDGATEHCFVAAHDAIAEPGAVERMAETLRSDRELAVVFARRDFDHFGTWSALRSWRLVPAPVQAGEVVRKALYFTAPCWVVGRRAYERGVSVDPRLFLYGEEADLGLSARRVGMTCGLHLGARVRNEERTGPEQEPLIRYLLARNAVLLAERHVGRVAGRLRACRGLAAAVAERARARTRTSRQLAAMRLRGNLDALAGRYGPPMQGRMDFATNGQRAEPGDAG